MKQLQKSLLILGVCALFAFGQGYAQSHEFANFKRYEQANTEVRNSTDKHKKVVFMGNSITNNWAKMRPEFFSENHYIGRGISGQTSYQFLLRFREDVVNLNPKLVVINAGTNDVAENTGTYNEDRTFGNILTMVDIAKANHIKVILSSVLPAKGFKWNKKITDAPEKIQSLNKRIEAYAKKHKIPYVNYYDALVDNDGITFRAEYTKDGVHPNVDGYVIMEALVKKAIKKAL